MEHNASGMDVHILLPKNMFTPTRYVLLDVFKCCGVTVPAGFITDGASVPRMLWWLFPPTGRYFLAAVIHDYLLDTSNEPNKYKWPKANKKFKEVLNFYKLPKLVVFTLYHAVSVYGRYNILKEYISGVKRKH